MLLFYRKYKYFIKYKGFPPLSYFYSNAVTAALIKLSANTLCSVKRLEITSSLSISRGKLRDDIRALGICKLSILSSL